MGTRASSSTQNVNSPSVHAFTSTGCQPEAQAWRTSANDSQRRCCANARRASSSSAHSATRSAWITSSAAGWLRRGTSHQKAYSKKGSAARASNLKRIATGVVPCQCPLRPLAPSRTRVARPSEATAGRKATRWRRRSDQRSRAPRSHSATPSAAARRPPRAAQPPLAAQCVPWRARVVTTMGTLRASKATLPGSDEHADSGLLGALSAHVAAVVARCVSE